LYRLIIVEDEAYVRSSLQRLIDWKAMNCLVVGAFGSAEQALDFLTAEAADVILSDIRMEGLDGLEFARKAKAILPEAHIIFLTGYSEFSYAQAAVKLHADDFLLKPTDPEELTRAVLRAAQKIDQQRAQAGQDTVEYENPSPGAHMAQRAFAYLEENYGKAIGVDDVAAAVSKHPKYLCRLVKESTGQTLMEYLRKIRLRKGLELLNHTSLGIAEVARKVGMEDAQYFAKLFKKAYGLTPSEQRESQIKLPISTKALPGSLHGLKNP